MILNPCSKLNKMVGEKICKNCREKCRYANITTEERVNKEKKKERKVE